MTVQDWRDEAACRNDPHPEDWFEGAKSKTRRDRTLRICFRCPVRNECLAFALEVEVEVPGDPHGTFGGLTGPERGRLIDLLGEQQRVAVG